MKWKTSRTTRLYALTAFLVIAASMLFYFFLFRTSSLGAGLSKLIRVLNPIIYGYVIAYILNPIMCLAENGLYTVMKKCHVKPSKRLSKFVRFVSAFFALGILILIIYLLASTVIPELFTSIQSIMTNFQKYIDNITSFLDSTVLKNNEELDSVTTSVIKKYAQQFSEWMSTDISPKLNSVAGLLTSGIFDFITFMKNFLLGLVVSMYVLFAKETLLARLRRFIYSVFSVPTANRILFNLRFADEKFGGFLIGKIIDSAIIGVICYFGCLIFSFPYALLVSVFVGITNIIPFFGPFIGAVPAAILIFVVDPFSAFLFIIFILCLQQFDGNILGPKILGSSVGVSSYMVIVSILIGSGFFGVTGMILAVPVAAIIIASAQTHILRRGRKCNLPCDLESYHHLEKVNPETNEFVEKIQDEDSSTFIDWLRNKREAALSYELPLDENPWDLTIEQIEADDLNLGRKKTVLHRDKNSDPDNTEDHE